jgi:two-component system cell cycle sensor histidine kinase/response regulator CckA
MNTQGEKPTITGRAEVRPFLSVGVAGSARDENYFEVLFEHVLDAIVVLGDAGQFLDANRAACQLIGLDKAELLGRNVAQTIEIGSDFELAWSKFRREGHYRGQRWLLRSDGARRLIEIRATGNVFPKRHLAVWRDVTDRYFLEHKLVQKERDEALARLSGGIAHDFTNLLSVISGHTEMARQAGLNSEGQPHLDRILAATRQAAGLAAQLAALARSQVLSPAVFDLNTFVRSCRGALRSLVPENIELVMPETKEATRVHADRTQMAQVMFTLASTASELLLQGGRLTIEIRNATLNRAQVRPGFEIPPGDYVVLEFRTRPSDRESRPAEAGISWAAGNCGVGAVLPPVTATVRQNNGFVWAEGNLAEGATLGVYFPQIAGGDTGQPRQVSGKDLSGSETILLVEDDPPLREATREYLNGLGYHVIQAGNGEEAMRTAQSAEQIDVLITDLIMPRMGGKELVEKISVMLPGIKVMFVSGNVDGVAWSARPGEVEPTILSKPFEMRMLAATLRHLLDRENRASSVHA